MPDYQLLQGDCAEVLKTLPEAFVQCLITSPPYFGLRSYLPNEHPSKLLEIGSDDTLDEYINKLVLAFRESKRVLKKDGTLWLVIGDSYASANPCDRRNIIGNGSPDDKMRRKSRLFNGLKEKDLMMIPARVALALQADGWYLRSEIIWHKPNPIPEPVKDRPTKSHETIYLLSKSRKYFCDMDAIKEPSTSESTGFRNRRSVWSVMVKGCKGTHYAVFPPELIEPCVLAGSRAGDTILDPFYGSGTTIATALKHGRNGIGIDLNPANTELAEQRIAKVLNA